MKLCMERRGVYKNTTYLDPTRADISVRNAAVGDHL